MIKKIARFLAIPIALYALLLVALRIRTTLLYIDGLSDNYLLPLIGDDEAVAEATLYRREVLKRLVKGLMRMGVEGMYFFPELQKELISSYRDASWWLANRYHFDQVDDTILVQMLAVNIPGVPMTTFAEGKDGQFIEFTNQPT